MSGRWTALVTVLCVATGMVGTHGCEGKQRPFVPVDELEGADSRENPQQGQGELLPGPGGEGAGEGQGASTDIEFAVGSLGSRCVVDSGCNSGYCVAGRCCEGACDGLCEACSARGLCDAAPVDDERCAVIACALTSTTCAEFPTEQSLERCASPGVCKTVCDPLSVAVDTLCEAVAEDINGSCDAAGNCVDPRAALGAVCQSDRDCVQGTCVDGVCCQEACGAACERCDETGSCVSDAVGTSCGGALQCFGRALCLAPAGSVCGNGAECGSGNCEPAVGGGSVCCSELCADGLLCSGDGLCVSPEADLGTACNDDSQCIGGRCFDGVCCDGQCGGPCERCDAPGQVGRCSAEPVGSVDPLCAVGQECAGRGQCRLPLGAACSLNAECRSGECGAALQGAGEICCETTCPSGQRCAANGSCAEAPRPDGTACSVNADCSSNSCVAGRCCESACNGVCQACSGLGDCNINPGNDARCPVIDCPTSNTVCASYPVDATTNLCAAFGSCRNPQQECLPRFAPAGTACENFAPNVRGICDGSGGCADPRVGLGAACVSGAQCESGNCSGRAGGGTVCCDAPCNGLCEACSPNGSCELRDNGSCPPGQECSTRTTCALRNVPAGTSCLNGESCSDGAVCLNGVCRGQCRLVGNAADGSRYDDCVLAQ
jgi:hypothetical protein